MARGPVRAGVLLLISTKKSDDISCISIDGRKESLVFADRGGRTLKAVPIKAELAAVRAYNKKR
jgi:hypothetical protein